jgi:hypothetical protein
MREVYDVIQSVRSQGYSQRGLDERLRWPHNRQPITADQEQTIHLCYERGRCDDENVMARSVCDENVRRGRLRQRQQ